MALISILLACNACSDFLEVESPSKLSEKTMYATEGDAYRALLGVYAVLAHGRIYGSQASTYFGYNNDIEFANGNAATTDDRRGLWDFTATSANTELESFNYMYTAINRANECITGMENSDLFAASSPDEPSVFRHMYGEAKAARALMYMELTRNWGDVPFMARETRPDDDFYGGVTDRDTIQAYIIRDLMAVEPAMYYAGELNEHTERLNRGAVQGLIARLALTRGGWSLRPDTLNPLNPGTMYCPPDSLDWYRIANTYCKKLIESGRHSLKSSFFDVFYNQCQEVYPAGDDMLYEVGMAPGYNSAIGHNLGVSIDPSAMNKCPYGYNNAWYFITLPYFYSFAPGDSRRDVSCCLYQWYWEESTNQLEQRIQQPSNAIRIGKWSKLYMKTPLGSASYNNTGINWPVIRYADVLLMLAETENKLYAGPTQEAKDALREVRRRAFTGADLQVIQAQVDDYVNGLTTAPAFFEAIVNERAWEFAGESIRKYDLIRWNMLRAKIHELGDNLKQMWTDSRNPGDGGRYANVPNYLYWKKNADGTLDIANIDQNMPSAPPGYTSFGWASVLCSSSSGVITGINQYDRNYRDEVIRQDPLVYIYPFHKDVIAESKSTLRNYYGKR
ncbi:MAG: RagB/SusD family nutrient uptake outer membrane protein [Tannerella sp.]|nr:RagB/SusD family nutrient uptake outer membrane protein [Tannerella sp.]